MRCKPFDLGPPSISGTSSFASSLTPSSSSSGFFEPLKKLKKPLPDDLGVRGGRTGDFSAGVSEITNSV